MSPDPADQPLFTLLRRVRRRWVIARAARRIVLVSMVVAIAIIVLCVTLGLVPMSFPTRHVALAAAAVIAMAVCSDLLRRWPSDARVARHVDAALELRELLATGLAANGDDPGSRMVRASAIETARRIAPRDVPERFPSPNSILVALLLLGGAMTANSLMNGTAAREDRSAGRSTFDPSRGDRLITDDPQERASPTESVDPTKSAPHVRQEASSDTAMKEASAQPASSSRRQDGSTSDSSGASSGETETAPSEFAPATPPRSRVATDPSAVPASGDGPEATGPSGEATNPLRAGASSPRTPSRGESERGRSGSHAESEPGDSAATLTIPDRHRDLVRAYFDTASQTTTRPSVSR